MKITVISANQSSVKGVKKEKGQSLFIQSENHNFLFNFGAGTTFLKNMQTLGVSCDAIDTAILSCGNTLYSGGLLPFFTQNRHAAIYARVNAFDARYQKTLFGMKNVAPDARLSAKRRILRCKNYFLSKDGSFATFSLSAGAEPLSPANATYFFKNENGNFVPDNFSHEMYLLVRADKRWALFCGDAHAGIERIVEAAQDLVLNSLGGRLAWVIGGFNLTLPSGKPVPEQYIDGVATALADRGIWYYTGHSTHPRAYTRLISVLGDSVAFYAAGDVIEL
ncbi:MAG: MBL fold metallo-hydrolase [Clostridia bacterium]|nr:MBL fold metallo-hydrolase [Clostridia bacterium]